MNLHLFMRVPRLWFWTNMVLHRYFLTLRRRFLWSSLRWTKFWPHFFKAFWFLHVCPKVVLLHESNIAPFVSRFIICHREGTFETVWEEQTIFWPLSSGGFVVFQCVLPVVLLDQSNIALFALKSDLLYWGRYLWGSPVYEEQFWPLWAMIV